MLPVWEAMAHPARINGDNSDTDRAHRTVPGIEK